MGRVRDDAMERLGQYRVELTGGGGSWGPGGVGDEMQSVCASYWEDSGAGDGHGRKAGVGLARLVGRGSQGVWGWQGVSWLSYRIYGDFVQRC